MKKGIIFFGPAQSGKSRKAYEIAAAYPKENVEIYSFRRNSIWGNPFVFSTCNRNTELIIIDELVNLDDIEGFFHTITGNGLEINKRGKDPFYIRPKVLIICDSSCSISDFPQGASFKARFNTYQFPEAYENDIKFNKIGLVNRLMLLFQNDPDDTLTKTDLRP